MGCCGSSERPNSTEKEKIEDDVVSNGFKQNNLSVKNKNKVEPLQKQNKSDPLSDSKFVISNLSNTQTRIFKHNQIIQHKSDNRYHSFKNVDCE